MASKSPLLLGDLLTKISRYHVDYESKLDADAERIGLEKTLKDPRVKAAAATERGKGPTRKQNAVTRPPGRVPLDSELATREEVRDLLGQIIKGKSSVELLRERYPEVYRIYSVYRDLAFRDSHDRDYCHYGEMYDFVVGLILEHSSAVGVDDSSIRGYVLSRRSSVPIGPINERVSDTLAWLDRDGFMQQVLRKLRGRFARECKMLGLPYPHAAAGGGDATQTAPRPVEGAAAVEQTDQANGAIEPSDAGPHGTAADEALLSASALSKQFHVPHDALRKRLQRFRTRNHNGWIEDADRTRHSPRFLYEVGAVRHIVRVLQARSQAR